MTTAAHFVTKIKTKHFTNIPSSYKNVYNISATHDDIHKPTKSGNFGAELNQNFKLACLLAKLAQRRKK